MRRRDPFFFPNSFAVGFQRWSPLLCSWKHPTALIVTLSNADEVVGRGFDVTADSRLLYRKGAPGSRLLQLDKTLSWDFVVSEVGAVLTGVPSDVDIVRGRPGRETTPVCSFREMATHFNKKSSLTESIPLGSFNSLFSLTRSWKTDEATVKTLAVVGDYIPLFKAKLVNSQLVLHDDVKLFLVLGSLLL